jgi:nucleolar protein 58
MIVLFDTPAGYSLFKVSNDKKLAKTDAEDIHKKFFSSSSDASSFVNLISFQPFVDTADAVSAATACIEGKVSKTLKSFLKKQTKQHKGDALAIVDKSLASDIKDKISGVDIVSDDKTLEIFRGIRTYMDELLENSGDVPAPTGNDIRAMQLGLSHSLSRYKLKFSADKVDTMVIQAVGLLDELDKEINTYAMRVKEWYGWHFPGTFPVRLWKHPRYVFGCLVQFFLDRLDWY